MITKLIFSDGRVVSSGGQVAVMGFSLTRSCNTGQELNPGACCAAMAQFTIIGMDQLPEGEIRIQRTDGQTTVDLGLFTPEKPERSGPLLKVTAYDRLCRLDRDLTDWLKSVSFPITLQELTRAVCQACGLESEGDIPMGDYPVAGFSVAQVTGRQLLQWVGALVGGFWLATAEGKVQLSWYKEKDLELTAGGQNYYYENSLTLAGFDAQPIGKVQLKKTATDVGLVYPNITGAPSYICTGNPLFSADDESLVQSLFDRIGGITYTPCQVTVPEQDIVPGDLIRVEGRTVAVMTTRLQNGRLTIEATGSSARDSASAVNEVSLKGLNGRVLEIDARVEGLTAENRDQSGNMAKLQLAVEGLQTTVSKDQNSTDQRLTSLEQTAEALTVQVQKGASEVRTTTGYTFGADGLTIARSGTQMANRLDHTGMYVQRAGQVILQASASGVQAADVQVDNYLHIGTARFEDYGGRTACFYVE